MRHTPATPAAKQYLSHVWQQYGLPATSFDHWSLDYARDVYAIVQIFSPECDTTRLIDLLTSVEVWDPDTTKQQWEPSWRPERSKHVGTGR